MINEGIEWQVGLVAFFLTLAASCVTVVFRPDTRSGWSLAAATERTSARLGR